MTKKRKIWELYCYLTNNPHKSDAGLCGILEKRVGAKAALEFEELFRPGKESKQKVEDNLFWGDEEYFSNYYLVFHHRFGPTRENLLLLYAACKNEL